MRFNSYLWEVPRYFLGYGLALTLSLHGSQLLGVDETESWPQATSRWAATASVALISRQSTPLFEGEDLSRSGFVLKERTECITEPRNNT